MNRKFIGTVILITALWGCAHSKPTNSSIEKDPLTYGKMESFPGSSKILLAAPHGGFDLNTDQIVAELSKALGWSAITANGYRTWDHPINVNRPTEGIGLNSREEKHTEAAEKVFALYSKTVHLIAGENPNFYIEIHGHNEQDPGLKNRIEIATVGINLVRAKKIKAIFEKHLVASFPEGKFSVGIENVDDIYFVAYSTKKFGILKDVKKALHIELPSELRRKHQTETTMMLEKILREIYPE